MDRTQLLNDAEAAITTALDGRQARIWTALPGIVQSVDWDMMTVEVQPAIQGVATNSQGAQSYVNLPKLVDVPICFPSAGGFLLTLPIAADDEVLVIIASRCIDAWWQNGGANNVPLELRMHDLSDGFAIPGPRSQPNVPSGAISSTNAQLRNDAGTTYVEITPAGNINLISPTGIQIAAPSVVITGDLAVTGDLGVTGLGAITGELTANGVPVSTHVHSGVQTGSSDTGPPT